jgi:hypothetical protein
MEHFISTSANSDDVDVASAIDVIASDILRNARRRYPPGHPVRDLPSIATSVEYQMKRGRLDDARHRAEMAAKYIAMYDPSEEGAKVARDLLERRFVLIAETHLM